jgi:cell wall-associated NlpC family hydrolase
VLHRPHRCVHFVNPFRAPRCLRRGAAPYALIGSLAACLVAVPAFAAPPSSSIAAKRAEAQQVLNEINSLNASLSRADELLNLANLKLAHVRHDIEENRRELRIAKQNLAKSRRTIAKRLVTLYTTGTETSTLELILGAKNLDDILNQIDTANRVSSVDSEVIGQVEVFKASVKEHARKLAEAQRQVTQLVAMRRTQQRAIEVRLGERRSLLSSLNSEIAQLVHQQEVAQMISAQRARQRAADAQTQLRQAASASVVGASASTPEGATVLPPSSYGGVVGVALGYQGVPYVWGGASPSGFDCSGLVMYAYAQVGVSLPHSSYAQYNMGVAVPRDQLEPGDLVFFDGLGHVGLYIGGGMFVHAPHSGTVVQVASLDAGWYAATYVGARRIL